MNQSDRHDEDPLPDTIHPTGSQIGIREEAVKLNTPRHSGFCVTKHEEYKIPESMKCALPHS
ncbi:MAG: hypothetical protein KAH38_05215 [Candidatus Hydrogenedentes bacterium]|nr:hypothetical protein [Candidatus Hydrogenedentota bacterium]